MRRCRSAKQRLWLGPHRYRGSCRHTIANRDAYSYANSNGYAFGMRRHSNPDAYGDGDTYWYPYRLSV